MISASTDQRGLAMSFDMTFESDEGLELDDLGHTQLDSLGMSWMLALMNKAELLSDEEAPSIAPPEELEETAELASILVAHAELLAIDLQEAGATLVSDDLHRVVAQLASLIEGGLDQEQLDVYWSYRRETMKALMATGTVDGRVPAYKFESNDGWLVSPEECRIIAYGLRSAHDQRGDELFPTEAPAATDLVPGLSDFMGVEAAPMLEGFGVPEPDEAQELLLEWADYNERAAGQGGYRVD